MTLAALGRTAISLTCLIWLGWNAALVHVMATRLHMNDFGRIYYSAVVYLSGQDMYGPSPATLIPVYNVFTGTDAYLQLWNLNPPHFHLPLLLLALIPPQPALAVWGATSLASLALSLHIVMRETGLTLGPTGRRLAALGLAAFSATGAVMGTGQLTFLLLLPVTLAWVAARGDRWITAGVLLGGAMSVKPFLAIFIPYMLLRRCFLSAAAACVTVALAFAVGLAVFGFEAHRTWLAALSDVDWAWVSMNASMLGLLERTLDTSLYFAPLLLAPGAIRPLWILLAGAVAVLTLRVAAADRTVRGVDRGFALVLLGALLISPLGWLYYLWLPVGPFLTLAISWWRREAIRPGAMLERAARWPRRLLLVAIPGLVWPVAATLVMQPRPWATVFPGSAYFLATAALWGALLADWRARGSEASRRSMRAPVMERPAEAARRPAR